MAADQAALNGLTGGDPTAIKNARDAVNMDNIAITDANDAVTTLQAKLTIVTTQKLTPKAAEFIRANSNTISYPVQTTPVEKTWLTDDGIKFFEAGRPPVDAAHQQIAITLDLPVFASSVSNVPAPDPKSGLSGGIDGLAVRFPVVAHVQICGGNCTEPNALHVVGNQTAPETDVMLPQLGPVVVLALKGSTIQNSSLMVSVGTDGTVSNVTTKDSSTLTQIFNTISSAFTSLSTQNNQTTTAQAAALTAQNGALTAQNGAVTTQTAATTAAASANDNALKAQADCLTQRKAIFAAGAVPVSNCQ